MNISIITSIKAPYRTKQIEEICKVNRDHKINVYYTANENEGRDWQTNNSGEFKESFLKGIKFCKRYGYINSGLIKIVKKSDIIFIGGYEKPTYILLSILCKIFNKKYVLIFDGISVSKISKSEQMFKFMLKKFVVRNSDAIFGNGKISLNYFTKKFNYPKEKIYNQYLTIDGEKIKLLNMSREINRNKIRQKYSIDNDCKVLQYSGRLVDIKNVEVIIKAISEIEDEKITLFITGDGVEKDRLIELANSLNVKIIVAGFIKNQEELFKHYHASDIFILPSKDEPWGLVANEAMYAKLPVLISKECGCSLDLVKNNGYTFDPYDEIDLANKIKDMINDGELKAKGEESYKIIEKWSFKNSAKNFKKILLDIGI